MSPTEKLEKLILSQESNINAFSKKYDIPYMTVKSILDRGVEKASVTAVIKICKALGITVDDLFIDESNKKSEVQAIYDVLSPENQRRALAYMTGLLDSAEQIKKAKKIVQG